MSPGATLVLPSVTVTDRSAVASGVNVSVSGATLLPRMGSDIAAGANTVTILDTIDRAGRVRIDHADQVEGDAGVGRQVHDGVQGGEAVGGAGDAAAVAEARHAPGDVGEAGKRLAEDAGPSEVVGAVVGARDRVSIDRARHGGGRAVADGDLQVGRRHWIPSRSPKTSNVRRFPVSVSSN